MLILPPYQFDKTAASCHWVTIRSPLEEVNRRVAETLQSHRPSAQSPSSSEEKSTTMWTFVGHQDPSKKQSRFSINTSSPQYRELAEAHVVAHAAPICPATLIYDIMIEALFSLHPGWKESGSMQPAVHGMVNHLPICFDSSRTFYMDLTETELGRKWSVHFSSAEAESSRKETHVDAYILVHSLSEPEYLSQFSQYERFVSHSQAQTLLNCSLDDPGVEVLQGRQVYRAFNHVVDYAPIYRGVRHVVGRGFECAGQVQLDRNYRRSGTWLDVPLSDSVAQIGGMWANLMSPELPSAGPEDIFIAKGAEVLMRSPSHDMASRAATDVWHVIARPLRSGERDYLTDMFMFDAKTGKLVEVLLGVQWGRVAKASMSRMLEDEDQG